jgi:hypothetical protein
MTQRLKALDVKFQLQFQCLVLILNPRCVLPDWVRQDSRRSVFMLTIVLT